LNIEERLSIGMRRLVARFTVLTLVVSTTEWGLAHVAEVFALEAEMLLALFTVGIIFAVVTECLIAFVTDKPVFAFKTEHLVA
jgi:hypothetical protein